MVVGIVAHGAYIPRHRLARASIAEVLGGTRSNGSRSVAGYDEDTTTLAVEAGRIAVRRTRRDDIAGVYFATAAPAYLDKTNATAIHAALRLDSSAMAVDMAGSVRSGAGVVRAALDAATAGRTTLAVFADVRTGMPGGTDERDGGDAGAAIVFGDSRDVIAEVLGSASVTQEFLDRWRLPAESSSRVWEERFGEQVYLPLAERAVAEACKSAGIVLDEISHVVITGPQARAVKALPRALGVANSMVADLTGVIGNTGTAHSALVLSDLLDRADVGACILWVSVADGADVIVLRTTDAIARYQAQTSADHAASTVEAQVARGDNLPYAMFLTWRGHLVREPPRREDPDRPMAPPSARRDEWKFGFVGSTCRACATRHLPPQRVCFNCRAVDQMDAVDLADVEAMVSTFTVDHLAYSPSPPTIAAIIDFDGGGRYQCELTDVAADAVAIGTRVEMTFRRLYTAGTIHDYFWKARPAGVA